MRRSIIAPVNIYRLITPTGTVPYAYHDQDGARVTILRIHDITTREERHRYYTCQTNSQGTVHLMEHYETGRWYLVA